MYTENTSVIKTASFVLIMCRVGVFLNTCYEVNESRGFAKSVSISRMIVIVDLKCVSLFTTLVDGDNRRYGFLC